MMLDDKVKNAAEAVKTVGEAAKDLLPVVGQQPVGWAMLLVGVVALLLFAGLGAGFWFMGRHVQAMSKDQQALIALLGVSAKTQERMSETLATMREILAALADRARVHVGPTIKTKEDA